MHAAKYRSNLPQLAGHTFLTDAGMETTLIFHDGIELPQFAAIHLMRSESGREKTLEYYRRHARIAREHGAGFVIETPTWRGSTDWGEKLGVTRDELKKLNRDSVALMEQLRAEFETPETPMPISGCVGPRGDGYVPSAKMSAEEAEKYHEWQVAILADTACDLISAFTINYVEEAIGITRAAKRHNMPVVISFTVETDGKLPTADTLEEAITRTDRETGGAPIYYMINCAHPTHFDSVLTPGAEWTQRIRGLRANSSKRSHAELNDSTDLDAGNPEELGREYAELRQRLPNLVVLGGCCGTDHRHIEQIALSCIS
jgi:S-methylmethionine-dependent homocysteine/selenocysteine methylase